MAEDLSPPSPSAPPPQPPPPPNPVRQALRSLARFGVTPVGSVVVSLALVAVVLSLWVIWPWLAARGDIGAGLDNQPSRLWGAARMLAPGDAVSAEEVRGQLDALGFTRAEPMGEDDRPRPATYEMGDGAFTLYLPERVTPTGRRRAETVMVRFDGRDGGDDDGEEEGEADEGGGGGVVLTDDDGDPLDEPLFLGAPLLASYYGEEVREIYPVRLEGLPDHVVQAVLAAEDHAFYFHEGVSPVGVARAAIQNARSGGVAQGGSTITQQLVKNVYLSPERTFVRKIREAVMALIIEQTHPKSAILQAYLNQIYLGNAEGLNFHGIGAASLHYFGVGPQDLTLAQAATLAGMIRSPAGNSPIEHPEASRDRRDQVLTAMEKLKYVSSEEAEAARAEPLNAVGLDLRTRQAPYFADAVAAEADERFGIGTLGDRGYHVFTTLDPDEQTAAERAVAATLKRLPANARLQGALVSVDPRDGRITAWVGGRDYENSEFDRVRSAHRQAGSAFKPVVLAAALESGEFNPSSRLEDSPLTLDNDGTPWTPKNYDGRFRGTVTLRRTIEESLNIPTVRVAQAVGWGEVAGMAKRLGIDSEIEERPSMALGAFEVTPLELARVYSTFATGGKRPTIHGIDSITDADGDVVNGKDADAEEVLDPAVAYRVSSILHGVVDSGTGRGAGRYGVSGHLAAKTGTSNGARDNWFAAYRPDRVTVVWVGHDDPQPTPLSGAQAALPVWGAYARRGYPKDVPDEAPPPDGVTLVEVCRESGLLPRSYCPTRVQEAFLDNEAPTAECDVHAWRYSNPDSGGGGGRERPGPLGRAKRKLEKIFG